VETVQPDHVVDLAGQVRASRDLRRGGHEGGGDDGRQEQDADGAGLEEALSKGNGGCGHGRVLR
jgi:hypothetical protein